MTDLAGSCRATHDCCGRARRSQLQVTPIIPRSSKLNHADSLTKENQIFFSLKFRNRERANREEPCSVRKGTWSGMYTEQGSGRGTAIDIDQIKKQFDLWAWPWSWIRSTAAFDPHGADRISISAGATHTCRVAPDGTAYCWGINQFGQLGTGDNTGSPRPRRVKVPVGVKFREISAGLKHTCAVDTENRGWCWGQNDEYQLGTKNGLTSSIPIQLDWQAGFKSISAGDHFSCGISADDSHAVCWGAVRFVPTSLSREAKIDGPQLKQVSVGYNTACGVTGGGQVYCWGFYSAVPEATGGVNLVFEAISVGNGNVAGNWGVSQGICAITHDKDLYCWEIGRPPVPFRQKAISVAVSLGRVGDTIAWHVVGVRPNGSVFETSETEYSHPFAAYPIVPIKFDGPAYRVTGNAGRWCIIENQGDAFCWGRDDSATGTGITGATIAPAPVVRPEQE